MKNEIRETTVLQIIVNGQRNWVEICRFDYLYTIHLLGQDMLGECAAAEALSIEEAIDKFAQRWAEWNECGPY